MGLPLKGGWIGRAGEKASISAIRTGISWSWRRPDCGPCIKLFAAGTDYAEVPHVGELYDIGLMTFMFFEPGNVFGEFAKRNQHMDLGLGIRHAFHDRQSTCHMLPAFLNLFSAHRYIPHGHVPHYLSTRMVATELKRGLEMRLLQENR